MSRTKRALLAEMRKMSDEEIDDLVTAAKSMDAEDGIHEDELCWIDAKMEMHNDIVEHRQRNSSGLCEPGTRQDVVTYVLDDLKWGRTQRTAECPTTDDPHPPCCDIGLYLDADESHNLAVDPTVWMEAKSGRGNRPLQRQDVKQLWDYLDDTGAEWGVVTDGEHWLLYRYIASEHRLVQLANTHLSDLADSPMPLILTPTALADGTAAERATVIEALQQKTIGEMLSADIDGLDHDHLIEAIDEVKTAIAADEDDADDGPSAQAIGRKIATVALQRQAGVDSPVATAERTVTNAVDIDDVPAVDINDDTLYAVSCNDCKMSWSGAEQATVYKEFVHHLAAEHDLLDKISFPFARSDMRSRVIMHDQQQYRLNDGTQREITTPHRVGNAYLETHAVGYEKKKHGRALAEAAGVDCDFAEIWEE